MKTRHMDKILTALAVLLGFMLLMGMSGVSKGTFFSYNISDWLSCVLLLLIAYGVNRGKKDE
ncbi:MAG TPA: hypothetical protein VN369_04715 [Terriglobales bacterium]|nr:hypothetical protein [Terriglobales bacterium]